MSQRQEVIKILSEESSKLREIGNGLGFLYIGLEGVNTRPAKEVVADMNNDIQNIAEKLEELVKDLKF